MEHSFVNNYKSRQTNFLSAGIGFNSRCLQPNYVWKLNSVLTVVVILWTHPHHTIYDIILSAGQITFNNWKHPLHMCSLCHYDCTNIRSAVELYNPFIAIFLAMRGWKQALTYQPMADKWAGKFFERANKMSYYFSTDYGIMEQFMELGSRLWDLGISRPLDKKISLYACNDTSVYITSCGCVLRVGWVIHCALITRPSDPHYRVLPFKYINSGLTCTCSLSIILHTAAGIWPIYYKLGSAIAQNSGIHTVHATLVIHHDPIAGQQRRPSKQVIQSFNVWCAIIN